MIKRFSQISMQDIATCGGKGSSLGEMTQAGFSVPNGFVLTTKAFGVDPHKRDDEILHAFDELNCKFVAVRSSGTKEDGVDDSFAGQFDTYLFVTKEKLIEQIIECHNSVNSERIISYCESKKIDKTQIKVAVVIQKMVNSESAGVCFTVNPVTGNTDEIMIEAGRGVGEAVVSGMITPDNYIVNKVSGEITKNISTQDKKLILNLQKGGTKEVELEETERKIQKLSDKHITELAELAKKIEKHYGKPMDTEWAVEDGTLYMLQARPVTSIGNKEKSYINYQEREFEFQQRNRHPLMMADMWLRALANHFKTESKLESIDEKMDYIISSDAKGWDKKIQKNKIMEEIRIKAKDFSYLQYICDTIQKRTNELEDIKNEILKTYEKENKEGLAKLRDKFDSVFVQRIPRYWIPYYITTEDLLIEQIMEKISGYKSEIEKLCPFHEAIALLTFPNKKTYFQLAEESLRALAVVVKNKGIDSIEANIGIQQHINNYGWLGTFLVLDIPIKNRDQIIEEINRIINKQEQRESKPITTTEDLWEIINKNESLRDFILWAQEYGRILTKSVEDTFRITAELQPFMRKIAKEINIEYNDFANYTPGEIQDLLLQKKLVDEKELEERRKGIVQISENGTRQILSGETALFITEQLNKIQDNDIMTNDNKNIIQGKTGYGGNVTGIAKICLGAQEAGEISKGEILITSMTTPDFVPAMKKAGAIITDEGGLLCHAAIISRELKVPCVIGTKVATKRIKNGQKIKVDANNGLITIL